MFDVKACRSCLTVKGKLEKIGDASKRQYSAITGLQISDDGYPGYFCVECRHHIRKSLAFRRKSRRAHFVLKEIMNVRKQISYSDIVTVNRRKTNLESSLDFWVPSNNPCFLLANEEGQELDSLQQYDVEHTCHNTRFNSKHLVEIKPERDTEIPDTPENETNDQDEYVTDNIPTNDYLETEPDIDMNDIFKDLEEKEVDTDNEDDYEPPSPKKIKTEKVERVDDLAVSKAGTRTLVNTMMLFNLKVLTLEEQKKRFEIRKRTAPFARSMFKCAMCLTVHKTMNELVEHVKYHNERKFGHECQVCKNKFPIPEDVDWHVANCHLYEYRCIVCRSKYYCQTDAVNHIKLHSGDDCHVETGLSRRRSERKRALSTFVITPLSQQMMHDVMLLRNRPERARTAKELDEVAEGKDCNYKCDICGFGFKTRKNMSQHMVLRHRFMYTCKSCKEVFTTRAQALEHYEDMHMGLTCKKCGKTFANAAILKRHRKTHDSQIPCNICGYGAKDEKTYYTHQLTEHGYVSINDPLLGSPEQRCRACGVQFRSRRGLQLHLVSTAHEGVENVQFACVPCKKLFSNEEELATHHVTCRRGRYPRKCCYCTDVLHTPMQYKMHYINVHPTLQYRYVNQNTICDVCGKSIFKPLLEAHMQRHATAEFECRLCSALNSTAAAHLTHLLSNHTRRPYRCALCRRRFKSRGTVKDHILKVHAPTKLFKCEFCDAEFSYFRTLKEHAQKLHNLVIPPIKPKIRLNSKDKLYVYAHMMIEINERERENVEKLKLELVDYLEQKSKPITDYNDYFIFNPNVEEVPLRMRKPQKRKRQQTEVQSAVAHITVDWPSEVIKSENEHRQAERMAEKIEIELGERIENAIGGKIKGEINENIEGEIVEKIEGGRVEKVEGEICVKIENEIGDSAKTDAVVYDNENENELMIDDQKPLEVIESDGHQYVMINGEMYRIAAEDDE